MGPVLSLIIILTLSILVTRIATIAIMHTGLSRQAAKFQARSAFTGVGFTTKEAEKVTDHPVRRKIVMLLMLLGNAGFVSALATLMLTFIDKGEGGGSPWWVDMLIIAGAITLLWILSTSQIIDRWLNRVIDRALKKYTTLNVRDYSSLLKLSGDYEITEMQVEKNDWIESKSLSKAALRKEGINILGITRSDGTYIGIPDGDTVIEEGDNLILYGRVASIQRLDERKEGTDAQREHQQAEEEQRREEEKQERLEAERKKKEAVENKQNEEAEKKK